MPRGTLTSTQGGDDTLRKAFLEDDIVECIVDLPGQLFHNTPIPVALWFFNKDKSRWKNNREGKVLFIDARKMGTPISRTQIEFSTEEISRIARKFQVWADGEFENEDAFARSVDLPEIYQNGLSLSPGRFVGTEASVHESDDDFGHRMSALVQEVSDSFAVNLALQNEIQKQMKALGHEL